MKELEEGTEGEPGQRKKPRSKETGKDRMGSTHLDLPHTLEVRKEEWERHNFTKEYRS